MTFATLFDLDGLSAAFFGLLKTAGQSVKSNPVRTGLGSASKFLSGTVPPIVLIFLGCGPGLAEIFGIKEITYGEIEEFVADVIDFEDIPAVSNDGVMYLPGAAIAEKFLGQVHGRQQDDLLIWHEVFDQRQPSSPLSLMPGRIDESLVVEFDSQRNSFSLFPLGPRTQGKLGTGTIAILFDEPVCYFAFRTTIDGMSRYPNVNQTILRGKKTGSLEILFFDKDGRQLARFLRSFRPEGSIELGFMQTGQASAQIAGIAFQNLDLRGIAIDDLRFDPICPYKLF